MNPTHGFKGYKICCHSLQPLVSEKNLTLINDAMILIYPSYPNGQFVSSGMPNTISKATEILVWGVTVF